MGDFNLKKCTIDELLERLESLQDGAIIVKLNGGVFSSFEIQCLDVEINQNIISLNEIDSPNSLEINRDRIICVQSNDIVIENESHIIIDLDSGVCATIYSA